MISATINGALVRGVDRSSMPPFQLNLEAK
jgi:hypothetical protein